MQAGDQVVYHCDTMLFGIGTIERVLVNGRLVVTFEGGVTEEFGPQELELVTVWLERDGRAAA